MLLLLLDIVYIVSNIRDFIYFLVVIFFPSMKRVEVLVRFTAAPPLVPSKLAKVPKEVKFPAELAFSIKSLNGKRRPNPKGPKKELRLLLVG